MRAHRRSPLRAPAATHGARRRLRRPRRDRRRQKTRAHLGRGDHRLRQHRHGAARRRRGGDRLREARVKNEPRWLMLIHQLPPKPEYLRVKIWRRMQKIGAVALKNAVYVLPRSDGAYEDFEWTIREIVEGGG